MLQADHREVRRMAGQPLTWDAVPGAMRRELVAGSYIQADETPVPVQMSDRRGKNHQAYLWQYGKPGGNVVFDFWMGRGRDGPVKFLGQYEGILQTDGYAAWPRGRDSYGACGVLGACAEKGLRRDQIESRTIVWPGN